MQQYTAVLFSALVLAATLRAAATEQLNGFDLTNASIPVEQILPGGPPRDGIPALDYPVFIPANEAEYLDSNARVIGLARNGHMRAYPIAILNWHEIVNDALGPENILVSYCPLCGTGMVFAARDNLRFGVSGLLYNSDVLMYDRKTESLWSQLQMEAISGPLLGQTLTLLPASHTTWAEWRARYPETLVLSEDTGHDRDYSGDPYEGYAQDARTYFPASSRDNRFHPKEQVIGVRIGEQAWAWPFAELAKADGPIEVWLGDLAATVSFDSVARTGRVTSLDGSEIPSTIAYWFAWTSFYPETEVYRAD